MRGVHPVGRPIPVFKAKATLPGGVLRSRSNKGSFRGSSRFFRGRSGV